MAGKMIEVARATVTIIPNMQGAEKSITTGLASIGDSAGVTAGNRFSSSFVGRIGGMKTAAVAAGAAIGAAAIGAAKGLFDIASEFDAMTDKIIVGTGASGEALEELQQSAKDIATSVPITFSEAGDTVQDLNTRLGLTGDVLTDVGTKVNQIGYLTEEAFSTETFSGAMAAWGEAANEMAGDLDAMFAVAQSTGISMNSLSSILESTAPTMKTLGYSFEETAAMAGLLDKAGLDASGTMSKMAKAMTKLAKDGEKPAEALKRVTAEIDGYIKAGDEAKALELSSELFGTRGAAQFVAAVKSGAMNVDEFAKSISNAGGIIEKTTEQTMDFPERLQLFKNQLAEFVEPLAMPLFDFLSEGMRVLTEAFSMVDPTPLTEAFANLGSSINGIFPEGTSTAEMIAGGIQGIVNGASDFLNKMAESGAVQGMADAANRLWEAFSSIDSDKLYAIAGAIDTIASAAAFAIDIINGLCDALRAYQDSVNNFDTNHGGNGGFNIFAPFWENIPFALGFAEGGRVTEPTYALIGEAGYSETVVPETPQYLSALARNISAYSGNSIDYDRMASAMAYACSQMGFNVDGRRLASATVSAYDSVNGARQAFANRGLAVG